MIYSPLLLAPAASAAAIITAVMQRTHLLMTLLALEGVILSLTMTLLSFSSMSNSMELMTPLILLSLGACEASLGLACLVSLSRSYGNDMCNTLSSLKW